MTINATNCSDGIDGLAGTLTLLSLFYLAGFLYLVVGHRDNAAHLLVPHNPEGARWAVLLMTAGGGLAGYLWHNAEPSRVLMGDAGSRFLGLLVGLAVLAAGNPFLIIVVAPVVLANGGSGILKIALLRCLGKLGFDIRPPRLREPPAPAAGADAEQHPVVVLLHKVRFPLHDHCRRNLGWSNSQVLLRFLLLQMFITPLLLGLLVKIR
jgi:phospho-N-acetylmuramoyl-pentapeptide-transferase